MSFERAKRVLSIAAVAGFTLVCAGPETELSSPRLVILYAPCTVSKAYLSPYNSDVSFTPYLAAFAQEATVFTRHHTEAGQSGIAYASIFTGSQADRHGVYRHPRMLDDASYLIAEAYADRGYETFFWNKHAMASPGLGYGQGVSPENSIQRELIAADEKFVEILEKLRSDPSYKVFLMANFTITHSPYYTRWLERFRRDYPEESKGLTPEEIAELYPLYRSNYRALTWNFHDTVSRLGLSEPRTSKLIRVIELVYKANVNELDRRFGALVHRVRSAGLLDESLIVFTADHGEQLYRENALFHWSHSMQLAPEILGVPLLIRISSPLVRRGSFDHVTRSIDVFPTMMGLSGLPLQGERGVSGADLSPALLGRERAPELSALSHTTVLVRSVYREMHDDKTKRIWQRVRRYFPDEAVERIWVSLWNGEGVYKLRNLDEAGWTMSHFDLDQDPGETRDLYDPQNPRHMEAAKVLADYKALLVERYPEARGPDSRRALPQQQEVEVLRSLGYVE